MMQISALAYLITLFQFSTLIAAAPPLAPPSSSSSPPIDLFPTAPTPNNVTTTPTLGGVPRKIPFIWTSPGNTEIILKYDSATFAIYRLPESVSKALENAYFETLYHLGPQGGGAATRLERPFEWHGGPVGEIPGTDLKVRPGPKLTWSIWSSALAGLYSFSLKYDSFDFEAEIYWGNEHGVCLGEVSFVSRR